MQIVNRKSKIENRSWLPDMDLNHDKVIQSHLCYRYTIGQAGASGKLKSFAVQSRRQTAPTRQKAHPDLALDCHRVGARHLCRFTVPVPTGKSFASVVCLLERPEGRAPGAVSGSRESLRCGFDAPFVIRHSSFC
jgi:hypothetical protein